MIQPFATGPILDHALTAGGWLAAGIAVGALHFLALRWNTRLFVSGPSVTFAMGAQLARYALTAGALVIIARYSGAAALLITTVGILMGRTVILRSGAPG